MVLSVWEGFHAIQVLPEITAGDHEVGLCGPEDVVDGSGGQHLPHGFVDDLLVLAAAHCHRAKEAHGEHLLQEGVYGNAQTLCAHKDIGAVNMRRHTRQVYEHAWAEAVH